MKKEQADNIEEIVSEVLFDIKNKFITNIKKNIAGLLLLACHKDERSPAKTKLKSRLLLIHVMSVVPSQRRPQAL